MDENKEITGDALMSGKLVSDGFSSADPRLMSTVEIIIPFHGNYSGVANLLQNIFATIQNVRYQITLVDDGSPNDGFIKEIGSKKLTGLVCHRKNKQEGFASAVNYALENCKNNWITYVCIMHSDVMPADPFWLPNLGSTLKRLKSSGIKMISSRSNVFDENMKHLVTDRSQKVDDYILNENEYLPMFCCLAHRDLFKRVGLLSNISLAGGESHEFASRMREKGFKQAIAGKSWVNHVGEMTIKNLPEKLKEILRKSVDKYYEEVNIKPSSV